VPMSSALRDAFERELAEARRLEVRDERAHGSWTGRAPRGNTGGADVGIFTPMEIPPDLRALLDA